jgi:peptide/nickel transport system substrate-binding protein
MTKRATPPSISQTWQRLSRRRLVQRAGAGATGFAAATLLGCSRRPASSGGASAPSNQSSQGTPVAGGTLNTYVGANPVLDPQKTSSAGQQAVGGVMSRLFRFRTGTDPNVVNDHNVENDLGISLESPDAVTWTVKLRTDAKFQNIAPVNGHAVQAEDIKATFARTLDPATGNPNRGSLGMIDPNQIQTPDTSTVVFKLNYPYSPFRKILASPTYSWIFPREVLAGGYDPSKTVVGSGPFTFDSAQPDVAYTYKRNSGWFENGLPHLDGVRVAVIPDPSQQLAQFSSGNLDELAVAMNDLDTLRRQAPKASVFRVDYAQPNGLFFQMGDPSSIFLDIRVRRALSLAVDRDAIGKVLYGGQAQQMLFVPALMGKWALQVKDLPPDMQQYYKYDPAGAKKLLAAAGQTDLQIKLGYVVNVVTPGSVIGSPIYIKHAETLANMLNAVGVKTTLVPQDYNKDFVGGGKGSRNGYFDKDLALFSTVAGYTDADEWLFNYFHSKSTSNEEHLSDPTYDAMVDKARTIVNEDDRLKAVLDIERYLADKMYIVPTAGTYQWWAINQRVRNYQFSSTLGRMTETYAKAWISA